MPKYLFEVAYTLEGVKGLAKEGGSRRRDAAAAAIKSAGGSMEALYFAIGENDVIVIADFPDNVSAAAASLTINSTGGVRLKTTALLTPEEIDQATQKAVTYRAPGR